MRAAASVLASNVARHLPLTAVAPWCGHARATRLALPKGVWRCLVGTVAKPHGMNQMMTPPSKVVLIVEDDPGTRGSLAMLLQLVGYSDATVSNGLEALVYLRTHPAPRLIVLDLRMPRMDGRRFLDKHGQDAELAQIPVVVCSGDKHDGPQ